MGWKDEQDQETTELRGTVKAVGKDAFLLELSAVDRNVWDDDEGVWIPFSQVEKTDTSMANLEKGDEVVIEIPEWLAQKKELIP